MNKNKLVKKYIIDRIDSGTFVPGQVIDSSTTMKDNLGVSLMTIRGAVQDLVDEGILYTEHGKGIFVSIPPKYLGFKCGTNFSAEIRKLGMSPNTKKEDLEVVIADEYLADIFNVNEGTKLWKVTRVRYADEYPVMDATEFFIFDQMPDLSLDIVRDSIYDFLEPKGIVFHHADQKIESFLATKKISERLNVSENDAIIKVTLISMVQKGTVFSYSIEYFRTDKFTLNQTVYA